MPLVLVAPVDDAALAAWLRSALGARRVPGAATARVVARSVNGFTSTFPSESLTVRLGDGTTLRLFCKHGGGVQHAAFGHRGGVAYEARVYRDVLDSLPLTLPRYYGAHEEPDAAHVALFVEHLDGVLRVASTANIEMLGRAARWAARCHALTAGSPALALARLMRYDRDYFCGWAARTLRFAASIADRHPWLADAAEAYGSLVERLLDASPALVHGEYYSRNVLARDGDIYPVDWESAAAGAGEIDLACLVEGWPAEWVSHCRREYVLERWPQGAPPSFDETLRAAQVYLHFRWLGDRADWTTAPSSAWRFAGLRSLLAPSLEDR